MQINMSARRKRSNHVVTHEESQRSVRRGLQYMDDEFISAAWKR